MKGYRRSMLGIILAVCVAASAAPAAYAAGTGDDPTPTINVVSPSEAASRAADDAWFKSWKKERDAKQHPKAEKEERAEDASGTVGSSSTVMDGRSTYLWTPSHPQERAYWCGPASVQIVTHYFGPLYAQYLIARYMGTTTAGTDFTMVDDALRFYSKQSYWYTGGVSNFDIFMDMCEFGIGVKRYPSVADVRINADIWPNYNFGHAGHILPIEAFDETVAPYLVRVNDPYNEASWQAGGGNTYGHKTYAGWIVANGVINHWRQAMVR